MKDIIMAAGYKSYPAAICFRFLLFIPGVPSCVLFEYNLQFFSQGTGDLSHKVKGWVVFSTFQAADV
jgi:hypothetical protein